jgi:hypothetical protein
MGPPEAGSQALVGFEFDFKRKNVYISEDEEEMRHTKKTKR